MKVILNLFLIFIMVIFPFSEIVKAEEQKEVQVTIPSFQVWLNGTLVNNINNQYPLIVYKDITYFPMTWSDSRFLGISTHWDQEKGLTVTKTTNFSTYTPYDTFINDIDKKYSAYVAEFPITVNHKKIHNEKEPYPLLQFRNVTYFPLTWRFAVEEFGWTYTWEKETGLNIDAENEGDRTLNNVLTILNQTAFQPKYSFVSEITLESNPKERIRLKGRVENTFKYKQGWENGSSNVTFDSKVIPSSPLPFEDAEINYWVRHFDPLDLSYDSGFGVQLSGGDKFTAMSIDSQPFTLINQFFIVGEMRESIHNIVEVPAQFRGCNRYSLTFDTSISFSGFHPKKMEIEVNHEKGILKEVMIMGKHNHDNPLTIRTVIQDQ